MEGHAGRDAGAAVGDELPVRDLRERFVPGRVARARYVTRGGVDRLDLPAVPLRHAGVEQDELVQAALDPLCVDRVAAAFPERQPARLELFFAGAELAEPAVELEHRAVVVSVVPQQPPEPLGASHRAVGDDEDAVADPGPPRRGGELPWLGERMSAAWSRRRGQIGLDVEERGTGNVTCEIELAPGAGVAELPAAIDELVVHADDCRRSDLGGRRARPVVHLTVTFAATRSPIERLQRPQKL